MSLLLDALKNAALEKQRREQTGQSLSGSDSHKSTPQPHEITKDAVYNTELKGAIATAPAREESEAGFEAATLVPDPEAIEEERLEFDLKAIEESYLLDAKDESTRTTDILLPIDAPKEPSEDPPLLTTTLRSDLDSQAAQFDAREGKDALNRLLSRSSQATKAARKRWVGIYALLTLTSVTLITVYYYLLDNDTNRITPLAMNTISVPPDSIPLDSITPDSVTPETIDALAQTDHEVSPETPPNDHPTLTPTTPAPVPEPTLEPEPADVLAGSAATVTTNEIPSGELPELISAKATASQKAASTEPTSTEPPKTKLTSTELAPTKLASTAVKPAIATKPSVGQASQANQSNSASRKDTTSVPSTSLSAEGVGRQMSTTRQTADERVSESIQRGYQAYQRGDFATAETAYREALAEDSYQRDALLGAAAVAVQLNRYEEALRYYQQRLARAPKDEYAQAGLLALTNSKEINPQFDSELNRLLREFPNAAHLHFLQGSQYASRQQWGAAQQAFFEAWQRDMQNPDYAFNLAVTMDHLQEAREAARFYRKALSLSDGRHTGFSTTSVQERLQALEPQSP